MAKAKKAKTAKKAPAKSAKKSAKKSARKPNAAFMAAMTPSSELAPVVGAKPLRAQKSPRSSGPTSRRTGCRTRRTADDQGRRHSQGGVGGKSTVNMFEMTKLVNKHLK